MLSLLVPAFPAAQMLMMPAAPAAFIASFNPWLNPPPPQLLLLRGWAGRGSSSS